MEEQAVMLEKVSWSIDMKQRFDDELCKIREIRRQKIELADQIPEEPPVDQPDTVHVMIKLPVGTRLERRFQKNHSLKYLYYFIFCHDESPDFFQVVTNFPRKVLPCQPTPDQPDPPTFAQVGLGRSEMLFVHDLEA
ncbi:FAS-associated factor 2-like [Centruroides sculpturatus]|uniref:FAS-associated factor 2-like n=1 Tax=Centruroides sculpturatus TaxID=218467 RepID=UPI000C6F01C2|nr:FAS-associated factor 2-like [Centruroides sculpturatus]